jgi:hypothetical protein
MAMRERYTKAQLLPATVGQNSNNINSIMSSLNGILTYYGLGTLTPARALEIVDALASQLRLSYTPGSVYVDIGVNSNGRLVLTPTGERIGFNCDPEANLHVRGYTNATFLVELDVTGTGNLGFQFKNTPAGTNRKFTDFSIGEYQVIQRFINDTYTAAKNFFKVTKGGADGFTPVYIDFEYGNITIGGEYGTSRLQLAAGTTAAESSPLKFISGPLMTTPEAGAIEFLTDDLYLTQTTGTKRKRVLLDDGVGVGYSPVGSIVAWHKSFTNTPALPSNWVECNGQTLSDADSPYNGQVIPNLNGAAAGADLNNGDNLGKTGNTFLRGDETSGVTQFDNMQGHRHTSNLGNTAAAAYAALNATIVGAYSGIVLDPVTDGTNGTPRTGAVTRPRNMSVVYVMRIK